MKFISLLYLAATVSAPAFAIDLQPELGQKMCVGRQYTKEELSARPKQKISKFAVIIEHFPKDQNWEIDHVTAKVIGEHAGKLWGNEAGCEYQKDGSLKCQIECDGGAFSVYPNQSSADFQVMKNYYFPLFKQGADPENPKKEDVLSLQYEDKSNRSFRLFEADTKTCVDLWTLYQAVERGC